jgi:hypothetical protein
VISEFVLKEKICSAILGFSEEEDCKAILLKFHKFTVDSFLKILESLDNDLHVRRIYIDIADSKRHNHYQLLGDALDIFLTPRTWWIIVVEDYFRRDYHKNPVRDDSFRGNCSHIFLLRYRQQWEAHLKRRALVQYPPDEVCLQTPLNVGSMVSVNLELIMT